MVSALTGFEGVKDDIAANFDELKTQANRKAGNAATCTLTTQQQQWLIVICDEIDRRALSMTEMSAVKAQVQAIETAAEYLAGYR